jgi:hypothetical protein
LLDEGNGGKVGETLSRLGQIRISAILLIDMRASLARSCVGELRLKNQTEPHFVPPDSDWVAGASFARVTPALAFCANNRLVRLWLMVTNAKREKE